MSKNLLNTSINDLLPKSISTDDEISSLSKALSLEIDKINQNIEKILFYPNIINLDEKVIDLLAEQFQVDFYDILGLDLNTKRTLVQNALIWHKGKGTKGIIQDMISTLVNNNCIVKEWQDYDGKPYHFKITMENTTLSKVDCDNIQVIVNELKNERSKMEEITRALSLDKSIHVVGCITTNKTIVIETETNRHNDIYSKQNFGGGVVVSKNITVGSGIQTDKSDNNKKIIPITNITRTITRE